MGVYYNGLLNAARIAVDKGCFFCTIYKLEQLVAKLVFIAIVLFSI